MMPFKSFKVVEYLEQTSSSQGSVQHHRQAYA